MSIRVVDHPKQTGGNHFKGVKGGLVSIYSKSEVIFLVITCQEEKLWCEINHEDLVFDSTVKWKTEQQVCKK